MIRQTALLGLLLSGCGERTPSASNSELHTEMQRLTVTVERLNKRLDAVSPDSRSSIPAIGDEQLEARLKQLETALASIRLERVNPAAVSKTQATLAELLVATDPGQQEQFLDRLIQMRWRIGILTVLASIQEETSQEMEARLNQLRQMQEDRPPDLDPQFSASLDQQISLAERTALGQRLEEAMQAAQTALNSADPMDDGPAWQRLQQFTDLANPRIRELSAQLQDRVFTDRIEDQCQAWREQLAQLEHHESLVVRRVGTSQIYDSVVLMQVELAVSDRSPDPGSIRLVNAIQKEIETALTGISAAEARIESVRRRNYQRWALEQIAAYESRTRDTVAQRIENRFASFEDATKPVEWPLLAEFSGVRMLLQRRTGIKLPLDQRGRAILSAAQQKSVHEQVYATIGWKYLDELAYRSDQEAATRFLLPIEAGLLERPVQNLLSRAFEKAWKNADDGGYQLDLAKQSVRVDKKALRDMSSEPEQTP